MKRLLLFAFSLIVVISGYSQEKIDTLFFDKTGLRIQNKAFADYYKIALYPNDTTSLKRFRDFYLTGELQREGYFGYIDSLNDNKSSYQGEIIEYFKNGKISSKAMYLAGKRHGIYRRYHEDGSLETEAIYTDGLLNGICRTFTPNGCCRTIKYQEGKPVHDYYLLEDTNGNTLKYRIADDLPIWESPAIAERFIDYRDGIPWEVYYKNGITIALTNSVIKDYGKWHRIDLIISNNSLTPIEFAPEFAISSYTTDAQGLTTYSKVWTHDEYLKKVNRAQTWMAIAVGISEGLATAGAGYSTSTTTGYNSNGTFSTYTTTTYNASAAYQTNIASQQRIANFSQALQDEKDIKRMGYLKKNTIYPNESVSGFVHVERNKGERIVFIITIEDAEYIYEWKFNKKSTYPID